MTLSAQEYFDSVVKHLMSQTKAAADAEGICVYHNEFGNRCAIGQALPPELAKELSEQEFVHQRGGGWQDVLDATSDDEKTRWDTEPNEAAARAVVYLSGVPGGLLVDTQSVHDRGRWRSRSIEAKIEMLIALKELASKHGLVWKEGAL